MIIKRIDVLSAGKISGIIAAAIGLIAGLVFLVFGSMIAGLAGQQEGSGLIAMGGGIIGVVALPRSEEHTSELQSLMRISYAVFCLKKKKKNIQSNKERY